MSGGSQAKSAALLLLCSYLTFASCYGQNVSRHKPTPTVTLTIRTGPEADAMKSVAEAFENREHVRIVLNVLGRDTYMTAMPTQLLARSSKVDLYFVPSTLVGEFAAAKAIAPLDEYIMRDPDLLVSYDFDGRMYALPTDVSTFFLFYRRDLIPVPPQTWDEFMTTAERFTRHLNSASPTEYGAGFSAKGPEEPPKVFYPILWSHGGFIFENGRVGLDRPECIAAAKYYQSLVTRGVASREVLSWSYPEVVQALEGGEIAMAAPMWNAAFADIQSSKSTYRGKIEVAPVPGFRLGDGSVRRVNFQHAWTLVMNAASQRPRLAARFVAFATGKDGGMIYAQAGGTPARRSLLMNDSLRGKRPEFPLLLAMLSIAKSEPAVPFYNRLHSAMNSALTALLLQQETPAEAMHGAAQEVRQAIQSK